MSNVRDTATPAKSLSFEDALAELEATVRQLEEGNLPLAEAIALYERGCTWPNSAATCSTPPSFKSSSLTLANGQQQRAFFFPDEQA